MKQTLCTLSLLGLLLFSACSTPEILEANRIHVPEMDLSTAADGTYEGNYTLGDFTYGVMTGISGQRIVDVQIVRNKDNYHARRGAHIALRIIGFNTPSLHALSGATITSTAIMMAVVDSLKKAGATEYIRPKTN